MCIRDRWNEHHRVAAGWDHAARQPHDQIEIAANGNAIAEFEAGGDIHDGLVAVSYTHLRAHETVLDLVCRLLLEKKKKKENNKKK